MKKEGYVRARKIDRKLPRKVEFHGTGKSAKLPKINKEEIYSIKNRELKA